ncbi:hypothetical protein ACVWZ3_008435 [Bradyrhizobium sp. i1.3.6]
MEYVGDEGPQDANRVDAEMRVEAAILDGDEGLRQIGGQVLQRDVGARHLAALRQHTAVDADDLDRRRALGNLQRLDRRQMGADIDHDADHGDHAPQAEHRTPIDEAAEAEASARFRPALGAAAAGLCLPLARRLVAGILALALGG